MTTTTKEPKYSEELVLRVNELFHDLTTELYQAIHAEMGGTERARWERIADRFLHFQAPAMIADVGTGNGFVPLTIAGFLKKEDTFICSDISSGMLEVAQKNIAAKQFPCRFEFVKIQSSAPLSLPFATGSLDALTMNSVLHHIRNTAEFIQEIDRVLKPGGVVVIGHEPNHCFRLQRFLWYNYLVLNAILNPKAGAIHFTRRIGLYEGMMRLYFLFFPAKKRAASQMLERTNQTLIAEKLIVEPLVLEEIAEITDVRDLEGFVPDTLIPNYQLLQLESYDHLLVVNHNHPHNPFVKRYDQLLARRYPGKGGTFFVALRKPL